MKFHKYTLIVLLILLSALSVTAFEDRGHIGADWGYGSSPLLAVEYTPSIEQYTLPSVGHNDRYSTVCDLDGDVDKELITFAGQFVQVFSLTETGMMQTTNEDIGEDVIEIACVTRIENSAGRKSVLVFTETKARMYDYGGTFLTASDIQYTFPSTQTQLTQPHCTQFTSTSPIGTDYVCAVGNSTEIFVVSSGYNINSYNLTSAHDFEGKVIYDNLNKIIYSKNESSIFTNDVINTSDIAGMQRQTLEAFESQTQLVSYRDDFTGELVCLSQDNLFPSGIARNFLHGLNCYRNGVKTLDHDDPYGIQTNYHIESSQPVFYDVNNNGLIDICYVTQAYNTGNSNPTSKLVCVTESDTLVINESSAGDFFNYDLPNLQTIANFYEVDDPLTLVNGELRNVSTFYTDSVDIGGVETSQAYAIDLDADDTQEIVENTFNFVNVYAKARTAVDNITINTDAPYDGLYGFIDPTCELTTFPIRAKECVNSLEGCTYINNNPDLYVQEKLCTTCGGTQSYHCGDLSYTNPEVNCQINVSGTYPIEVEMFTTTNLAEVAQVFDMSIVVATTSCDDPEDLVPPSGTDINGTTPENGETPEGIPIEDITSALLKNIFLIIAFGLILGVPTAMYIGGVKSIFLLFTAAFLMTILASMLGMIPMIITIYIIIAFLVIGIVVGVVGKALGGGQ